MGSAFIFHVWQRDPHCWRLEGSCRRKLPWQLGGLVVTSVAWLVLDLAMHSHAREPHRLKTVFVGARVTRSTDASGTVGLQRMNAVEDADTMGALFTKYYRLQEQNRNLETDTKVAVVTELLEVLDDLERALQQAPQAATPEVSSTGVLAMVAEKLGSKLTALGFERMQ